MRIKGGLPVNTLIYCDSAATLLKLQDAQEGEEWKKYGVRTCIGTYFTLISLQRVTPALSPKNFIQVKEIQMLS